MSGWLKALIGAGSVIGAPFTGGASLAGLSVLGAPGSEKKGTPTSTLNAAPPELLELLKQLIAQQQAGQPLRNSAMRGAYGLLPQWARNSSTTPQAPGQGAATTGVGISTPSGSPDYDRQMRDWLARVQG